MGSSQKSVVTRERRWLGAEWNGRAARAARRLQEACGSGHRCARHGRLHPGKPSTIPCTPELVPSVGPSGTAWEGRGGLINPQTGRQILAKCLLRSRHYHESYVHCATIPLTSNHNDGPDRAHAKTRGPKPSGTRRTGTARDRGFSTCTHPVCARANTRNHARGRPSRPLRPLPSSPAWPGCSGSSRGRPPALLSPTPAGT